jgi:hypothetical protein
MARHGIITAMARNLGDTRKATGFLLALHDPEDPDDMGKQ